MTEFRRGAFYIDRIVSEQRERAMRIEAAIEFDDDEFLPSIPEDLTDELALRWDRHEEEAALGASGMDCYGSLDPH